MDLVVPCYTQIENHFLVDALAYVDALTPAMENSVRNLIYEEMKTFTPKDYLKDLPLPSCPYFETKLLENHKLITDPNRKDSFKDDPIFESIHWREMSPPSNTTLKAELDALQTSTQRTKRARKLCPDSVPALGEAEENLRRAIEYSISESDNLAVMKSNLPPTWTPFVKNVLAVSKAFTEEENAVSEELQNIRKKRKEEQLSYSNELYTLLMEKKKVSEMNFLITKEIKKMHQELFTLRKKMHQE